jgi:hypothetical protein
MSLWAAEDSDSPQRVLLTARVLLRCGASPRIATPQGFTAAHFALAAGDHESLVTLLISAYPPARLRLPTCESLA